MDAVPAGKYGKAALESLGVWDTVKDKLAQSENVRGALRLVARGETPLGIVYATDALKGPGLRASPLPETLHDPIRYRAVVLNGASDRAQAFLEFLLSGKGRAALAAHEPPLDEVQPQGCWKLTRRHHLLVGSAMFWRLARVLEEGL